MKAYLCAWHQWLDYEEGFGSGRVSPSQQKNKHIDTCVLISASSHVEGKYLFGEDGNLGNLMHFLTSVTCILQIT